MRGLLCACALLASCATTIVDDNSNSYHSPFGTPSQGLTIPAQAPNGWNVEQLLLEYGRVTEQRFLIDEKVLQELRSRVVPLQESLAIAPNLLHTLVESMLFESSFALIAIHERSPRLVRVLSWAEGWRPIDWGNTPLVPEAELDMWAEHPAYPIRTFVTLRAVNLEDVSAGFASMADGSLYQFLPIGDSGAILLTGFGPQLANVAGVLHELDETVREYGAQQHEIAVE